MVKNKAGNKRHKNWDYMSCKSARENDEQQLNYIAVQPKIDTKTINTVAPIGLLKNGRFCC